MTEGIEIYSSLFEIGLRWFGFNGSVAMSERYSTSITTFSPDGRLFQVRRRGGGVAEGKERAIGPN